MSVPYRPNRDHSSARQSWQHNARKAPAPQFHRFRNLPLEIRRKIYRFLLVDSDSILLMVKGCFRFGNSPSSESQLYDDGDNVHLTMVGLPCLQPNLLLANSTISEEASEVLYGENLFQFRGKYCWNDFYYFTDRLTAVARRHIRNITIEFPYNFSGPGERGLFLLSRLASLQMVRFHVSEDIMLSDVALLRKIRESLADECRVVMAIGKASEYYVYGHDDRDVRISSTAVATMRGWGWVLDSKFELVDPNHCFSNEIIWQNWLQKNRGEAVRSGLVPEFQSSRSLIWNI